MLHTAAQHKESLLALGVQRGPFAITPGSPHAFRTAMVDSSPYRGREVILQESVIVPASTLLDCVAAMREVSAELSSPEVDESPEKALRLQELHQKVRSSIQRHIHPPAFLGARAQGMFAKLQAFLRSISLETHNATGL
eukprot:13803826-Alexandrium_andersonii.AAC.1